MKRGGDGAKGGKGGGVHWDDDRLDDSEMNDPRLMGAALFEEEGEAKSTKAYKKMEENSKKKPWDQVWPLKRSCAGRFDALVKRVVCIGMDLHAASLDVCVLSLRKCCLPFQRER